MNILVDFKYGIEVPAKSGEPGCAFPFGPHRENRAAINRFRWSWTHWTHIKPADLLLRDGVLHQRIGLTVGGALAEPEPGDPEKNDWLTGASNIFDFWSPCNIVSGMTPYQGAEVPATIANLYLKNDRGAEGALADIITETINRYERGRLADDSMVLGTGLFETLMEWQMADHPHREDTVFFRRAAEWFEYAGGEWRMRN